MAPPALKQLGNKTVRVDTEAIVRLWGPVLYWAGIRVDGSGLPLQSAQDQELAALDTYVLPAPGTNTWGSRLFSYWIHDNTCGKVNTSGVETSAGHVITRTHMDNLVTRMTANNTYVMFIYAFPVPNGTHDRIIDAVGRSCMRYVARRYANNPAVIFACQAEPPFNYNAANWDTLRIACEATIDQIRAEYPTAYIGVPGSQWSQRLDGMLNNPVNRPNIFVKPHLYQGRNSAPPLEPTSTMNQTILDSRTQQCYDAGYPVIVGECGWGGRSNDEDLRELWAQAEEKHWGWLGWALRSLSGTTTQTPKIADGPNFAGGDLTPWGEQIRDESKRWYALAPPIGTADPNPPPTISIPAGAEIITDNATKVWTDTSWSTTVAVGAEWLKVTHTGQFAGFQFSVPALGVEPISRFEHVLGLIHASDAQLIGLQVRIYQHHDTGNPSTVVGPNLMAYRSADLGSGWRTITIPMSAFDFSIFEAAEISRIEIENASGGAMSPYYVAEWALVEGTTVGVPDDILMVTQPLLSTEDLPVAGPPKIIVVDVGSQGVPGVQVNATLIGGSLGPSSVITKVTEADGTATFDFLVVPTPTNGLTLKFIVIN